MIHAGDLCFTDRPAAPVNVSVTHLRADSATVSWNILDGETVIGFAISQQVKQSYYNEIQPYGPLLQSRESDI